MRRKLRQSSNLDHKKGWPHFIFRFLKIFHCDKSCLFSMKKISKKTTKNIDREMIELKKSKLAFKKIGDTLEKMFHPALMHCPPSQKLDFVLKPPWVFIMMIRLIITLEYLCPKRIDRRTTHTTYIDCAFRHAFIWMKNISQVIVDFVKRKEYLRMNLKPFLDFFRKCHELKLAKPWIFSKIPCVFQKSPELY